MLTDQEMEEHWELHTGKMLTALKSITNPMEYEMAMTVAEEYFKAMHEHPNLTDDQRLETAVTIAKYIFEPGHSRTALISALKSSIAGQPSNHPKIIATSMTLQAKVMAIIDEHPPDMHEFLTEFCEAAMKDLKQPIQDGVPIEVLRARVVDNLTNRHIPSKDIHSCTRILDVLLSVTS